MHQVDIKEIDTQLATVIATALKGEDVLILQDQVPILKLSRIATPKHAVNGGALKG